MHHCHGTIVIDQEYCVQCLTYTTSLMILHSKELSVASNTAYYPCIGVVFNSAYNVPLLYSKLFFIVFCRVSICCNN